MAKSRKLFLVLMKSRMEKLLRRAKTFSIKCGLVVSAIGYESEEITGLEYESGRVSNIDGRVTIPDNLLSFGKGVFDGSYSLTKIEYCGKLQNFPIKPVCPPERQALIDAKEAADKVALELKARQEAEATARAAAQATAEAEAKAKAEAEAGTECKILKEEASKIRDAVFVSIKNHPDFVKQLTEILRNNLF